jgi:hypothetical protein
MEYCHIENRCCYKCGVIKGYLEFYKDSHDKYGLQKSCKQCQLERNKKYNLLHRSEIKEKSQHYIFGNVAGKESVDSPYGRSG